MLSILRATAMLGGSSLVSIFVGLFSAKALAVLVGPSGLGFLSLLQSLLGLALLISGMGVGAGLIRAGASALAREDHLQVAALRQAIRMLFWFLGGFSLVVLIALRAPISHAMLGSTEHSWSVVVVGAALLFSLASSLQTSLLNAYHRIGALARINVVNSLLGTGLTVLLVWLWREEGIVAAIVAGSALSLAISSYFLRREALPSTVLSSRRETIRSAKALLNFGVPYTGSIAVGTGVQFILPALVLHSLGAEGVGLHRAAASISGVYLGFLITAMGQDYYPRISAAGDQPATLVFLVNQQFRLVMLLSVPMILGTLAIAPYLVPLIYTSGFSASVDILEWQLIGDLFKFTSWTMGYVVLVYAGSTTLFFVELVAGTTMLVMTWLGIQFFGLAGLGIGFLLTYMVHYVVVWAIVRRRIGLVWTGDNKRMFVAALLAASAGRVLSLAGLEAIRTPVALSLALIAAVSSFCVIWREVGGLKNVRTWI
jgi:PST family polysaccharide transporter